MSAGALRVRGKYLSGPGLSPGFLAGCLLALALLLGGAAHAGDPFDDARYAIGIKDNATALRLIDSGQFDVNMQNAEGYTLLSFAAGDGNLAMVQALLDRGADPGVRNSLGMTAQDRAVGTMVAARLKQAMEARQAGVAAPAAPAGNGDFDVIRHAIGTRNNAQAIAELDKGIAIDMQNGEGYTLLHFAAGEGNLEMVEELLKRGANPNLRTVSNLTPADRAVGTMVKARIKAAGGTSGTGVKASDPVVPARPQPKDDTGKPIATPANQSPHAKMCASRHYSSSALCSDSTCKMREYRKWQTCLKTGSYY